MAEMSGQGANQRGFDEHYKNTKKVTVYFYSTANDIPVRVSSSNPLPVSATIDTTGLATSAKQDTLLAELQLKADLTETQPVSLASVPSHAVTNAGTFAVQNTAALPAGTNNIGDVDVLTLPSLPAGTNAIGKLSANSGVDIGDVTVNNTTANPVPVQPPLSGYLNVSIDQTGNNNAVDVLTMPTVTETNSGAIKTAVETIDNIVSGAGVNQTQVGGTNIDTNSGNKSAGTQRVVLATDQPQLTNALKVDGSAVTQPVSGTVTTTESAPTTIYNGKKTVTTAGTRVTLAASQAVKSVTIKALSTNTGIIYVGDTSVASTNGFQLSAGETISMDIANLNTVNLDSSVSGESVTYIGVA